MAGFEDKYRKKNPTSSDSDTVVDLLTAAPVKVEEDEYKAFNSVPHAERDLCVRVGANNAGCDMSISYAYRTHMFTDGNGFLITMHFSSPISVTVHGRNLQGLYHKLSKHEVEWIQEYDPRKWKNHSVPGENDPCITGIEIHQSRAGGDDKAPGKGTAH